MKGKLCNGDLDDAFFSITFIFMGITFIIIGLFGEVPFLVIGIGLILLGIFIIIPHEYIDNYFKKDGVK